MGDHKPSIGDDLRASLVAWVRTPSFLIIALALAVSEALLRRPDSAWVLLVYPILIFHAGWLGAERIWYLRSFRGSRFALSDLWRFVRAFVGRFILLGLLLGSVIVAVLLVSYAISPRLPSGRFSPLTFWVVAALGVVADFVLTFVTPALAYSTRRVTVALETGIKMIRQEWPRSAPYVLIPPLAIWLVVRIVPREQFHGWIAALASIVSGIVGFAFKGAIARYYLRHHPTGDDGAAFMPKETSEPPSRPDA